MSTKADIAKCLGLAATLVAVTACVSPTREVANREQVERFSRILARAEADRTKAITKSHARELVVTPLHFRGRVVTPDGAGIADADIDIAVFDRVLEPFHFPFFGYTRLHRIQSDRNGYFHLTGTRGVAIHVSVAKPGYAPVDLSHRLYQVQNLFPVPEQYPMPTRREPAVFVLRPRTPDDRLREIASGAVPIPRNGAPIEISLTRVNPHGEAAGEGDVRIDCLGSQSAAERYDWSCRIAVPGGGVQRRSELDFIEAPASGYAPQIEIGFPADADAWRDRINEDLFLKLPNGNYALVTLKIRTRGDYYIALDGKLNEHGARLLD